jgi:hypothetical protein
LTKVVKGFFPTLIDHFHFVLFCFGEMFRLFALYLNWVIVFLLLSCENSFYLYPGKKSLIRYMICKFFSVCGLGIESCGWSFYFLDGVLWSTKVFCHCFVLLLALYKVRGFTVLFYTCINLFWL